MCFVFVGRRGLALLVMVVALGSGCATSFDIERRAVDSVEVSTSTSAAAQSLQPGQCFTEQELGLADATPVDCGTPHIAEFFAVAMRPEPAGAPWPGLEPVRTDASDLCNAAFGRITGVAGQLSALDILFFRPDEISWEAGDREVACFVRYPEQTDRRLVDLDPTRAFGLVSTFALAAGDCVVDTSLVDTVAVRVGACTEPHWYEVFASEEMPDGDFPGDGEVMGFADELCDQAFRILVGIPRVDSSLTVERLFPTRQSWDEWGDRNVSCALTTGEERTGSALDSGE